MFSVWAAVALCALAPGLTTAATLADYRQRLETAYLAADQLSNDSDGRDETDAAVISAVKTAVPEHETIDLPGGSVETDNRWLTARLDLLQGEQDAAKRRVMLTDISERLLSIAEAVAALDTAQAAPSSKDEDKRKLAEILRREEFQKPEPAEKSLFQKWLDDIINWFSRTFPGRPESSAAPVGLDSLKIGLQLLIFALIVGLIGFLLYRFAPFVFDRFTDRVQRERKDRVILGERVAADQVASDLFGEAETLARSGDLRAAIRKGYIATLCDLSDRNVVRLARYKTNRDYLREVRKHTVLFDGLTHLTGSFERSWYGLRPAEQADWDEFRARYLQTISGRG